MLRRSVVIAYVVSYVVCFVSGYALSEGRSWRRDFNDDPSKYLDGYASISRVGKDNLKEEREHIIQKKISNLSYGSEKDPFRTKWLYTKNIGYDKSNDLTNYKYLLVDNGKTNPTTLKRKINENYEDIDEGLLLKDENGNLQALLSPATTGRWRKIINDKATRKQQIS